VFRGENITKGVTGDQRWKTESYNARRFDGFPGKDVRLNHGGFADKGGVRRGRGLKNREVTKEQLPNPRASTGHEGLKQRGQTSLVLQSEKKEIHSYLKKESSIN